MKQFVGHLSTAKRIDTSKTVPIANGKTIER